MNPRRPSKPKSKFSSRNLNAVFKAPLSTKPVSDHVTRPTQRPISHMLVLKRASTASPVPTNTLNRKSDDMYIDHVRVDSKWAEKTEKMMENEVSERVRAVENKTTPMTVSSMVWTPDNVAQRLHTSMLTSRSPKLIENSGRWGDDVVGDEILQTIREYQIEKERKLPKLQESLIVDKTKTCHQHTQDAATNEVQSMNSRQKPLQRHGRATGRWAHFKKDTMHSSIHDIGSRWTHDQYERSEDSCCPSDRSRHEADYKWESQQHEVKRNARLPDFVGYHNHFSRSDACFDVVLPDDCDHALKCNSHDMDWSNASLTHPDVSLGSFSTKAACFNAIESQCTSSPSFASEVGSTEMDTAASSKDHHIKTERSESNELSVIVAEETQSSTGSSSNSLSNSSPCRPQQVQLPKHSKMLFDPKTGCICKVEDMMQPDKRQWGAQGLNIASNSKVLGSISTSKRTDYKLQSQANALASKPKSVRGGRKKASLTHGVVDAGSSPSQMLATAIKQASLVKDTVCISETSSATLLNAVQPTSCQANVEVAAKGRRVKCDSKHVEAKQSCRQESQPHVTKKHSQVLTSQTTRSKQQHRNVHYNTTENVRGCGTPSCGKTANRVHCNIPTQCEGGGNKAAQRKLSRRKKRDNKQKLNMDLVDTALLTQTADGTNDSEQQGIVVSPEDDGFEMVKSRRALLMKQKQLQAQVTVADATVVLAEKRRECASLETHTDVQHDELQEDVGMATKAHNDSRPRGMAAKWRRRNVNEMIKDKNVKCLLKQTAQEREVKKEKKVAKAKVVGGARSHIESSPKQLVLRPMKQVTGEASAELVLLRKSMEVMEESVKLKKNRQHNLTKGNTMCTVNDWKSYSLGSRTTGKVLNGPPAMMCEAKVPRRQIRAHEAATARRKHGRKVYVVKKLASGPASETAK